MIETDFLTLKQASKKLNIPISTIHLWARTGVFPTERIFGRYVISSTGLEKLSQIASARNSVKGVSRISNTLTLKAFLENRSRTVRVANPRLADFASVMARHIECEPLTKNEFLERVQEVFPKNAIAAQFAAETWDVFTFSRTVREESNQ